MKPHAARNVMQSRAEAPDSLDFFPTPPWATRALVEHVIPSALDRARVWEPAAGEGHMAAVLSEYAGEVIASDVHRYPGWIDGAADAVHIGSFIGDGLDTFDLGAHPADWIITNPPFNLAQAFATRALLKAQRGVALLVRTAWLEGGARFHELFSKHSPSIIAQFCERVPMSKGRWNPEGSTATAYCWVVWDERRGKDTRFVWIPPGCRTILEKPGDRPRFAGQWDTRLFDYKGAQP